MLKYLIIPLSDDCVSFCHFSTKNKNSKVISVDLLKNALFWAMKENLSIHFLFPKYALPNEIIALTESVDHIKIVPSDIDDLQFLGNAEFVVFDNWQELDKFEYQTTQSYIIRTSLDELHPNESRLYTALKNCSRINIVFTDIKGYDDGYESFIQGIIPTIIEEYMHNHQVQLNILTDRLMLNEMNNCNAGYESLTLAPDGNFYVCPAFWLDSATPIGDIQKGIDLKNPQLFRLNHAPICRECDAWQCKRCVWLNKKMTRELNTPSHEQCVISHIERKASSNLLVEFRKIDPSFMPDTQIPDVNYLDPFEKIINKQ